MILLESYCKDNPIKYNKNPYLNKIDIEIENNHEFCEEEEDEEEKNEQKEELAQELIQLNENK